MNRLLLTCEVSEGHRGAGDGGHPEVIEEAEIGHCFREWWVLIDNGVFWLGQHAKGFCVQVHFLGLT